MFVEIFKSFPNSYGKQIQTALQNVLHIFLKLLSKNQHLLRVLIRSNIIM